MEDATFVTRKEFDMYKELVSNAQDDNDRRIGVLEKAIEGIKDLAIKMGEMNVTMGSMVDELHNQGTRLSVIEQRPAERWEKIVLTILSSVVAGLIGYGLAHLGL